MATIAPISTDTSAASIEASPHRPRFLTYVDHFEHSCARHADRCAVSMGERFITYRDLDQRSRTWACRFNEHGCGRETLIAICLDRSIDLVVLLLGALRSGAAFLPLDPQVSPERARTLVQQSRATVVVTESMHAHIFDQCGVDVWCLESFANQSSTDDLGGLSSVAADPTNLAYLIYTSGSTGQPKGVAITHESFYHYVRWALNYYAFDASGVSVVHTSIAFDLTLTSIFCPLLIGMRIVLMPERDGIDGVARLLDDHIESISLLKLTPSHLQLLATATTSKDHSWNCDVLIVGGEQLPATGVRFWEDCCRPTRIFNEYGPTEATVGCCVTRVTGVDALPGGAMPIGQAIDDVILHLYYMPFDLNDGQDEGELFIGGRCLARGYFGAPAATAEKFVPDPTGNGDRLYRSGDWVRKRERTEGFIFVGRKDRQVKIGGVRVELEDVECMLREFPGVQDAAVAVVPGRDGKKALVAFLGVPNPDSETLELAALNRHLQSRIHSAVVPNSYYLLKRLPLNTNGKVNFEKLIRERASHSRLAGAFLPPRNPTEELLASLWRAVLGCEEIGIDDSFFALDGNSMKSIQFVYEARKHGLPLSTRDVFDRQSIRALAELVQSPEAIDAELRRFRTATFALVNARDRERMPVDVVDAYPLAMLQAGTLFESNVHFDSGTYHNVNSYHIACELNVPLLEKSFALISARHPILRTCYDYVNFREPLQLVYREAKIPLQVIDISNLGRDQQERYIAEFIDQEAKNHFDWTKPPLFRIFIHLRGQDHLQFTLSKHHSILDGWSAATLIAETMQNYFALLKGDPAPFQVPVEGTYREYVALEREALQSSEQRDFWQQTLQEAPHDTFRPWGGEKPRTNGAHSFAASRTVPIASELSALLKGVATRARAPLKSVLMAVHLRALAQITGNTRLVTGVVSHGRPDTPDADRALGLFINTVPFHILCEEQFSWFDLIRRIFAEELRVYPYQRYPMARMKKDAGGRNIFESIFYYTDFHVFRDFRDSGDVRCLDSAGFEQTEIPFTAAFSKHPLTSEISLVLHFHSSHFSEPQAAAIVGYFERALASLAHAPETLVFAAPLYDVPAAPKLSSVQVHDRTEHNAFDLFRAKEHARPDVIALATPECQLTYGTVLRQVEQLAAVLIDRRATNQSIVGICLDNAMDTIIAMLAVTRVHACFVILDSQWPDQRLQDILTQLEPAVLIVDGTSEARFPLQPVVAFDPTQKVPARNTQISQITGEPDDRAYIIFTSGSSGKPKGVMVSYHNLYCSTRSRLQYYEQPYERFLLLSRLTFDSAYAGIWGTLCSGGTLHVVEADQFMDIGLIAKLIQDDSITHFLAIPSVHRLLLNELGSTNRLVLQSVILAGEELTPDIVQAHRMTLPSVALYNEYGPSEATIWATVSDLSSKPMDETGGEVSMGSAVAHLQTIVLDPGMRPISPGVIGELYLAGPGVGPGYFKAPRLTAERFVPNSYASDSTIGTVLYRTGDLVRHTPNGELTFIRRADNQVKVRGFRIEIEEIERAFYQSFSGCEAVVRLREDSTGRKRICLYYTSGEGHPRIVLETREVRAALGQRLPSYLLPDEVLETEKLPRLPNNKLDRHTEPVVRATDAPVSSEEDGKPSSEIERALSGIWRDALGLPSVSVQQSFFEIGGDSLLANQIVLKTEKVFGVKLFLKEFYEEPVIAALAMLLVNKGRADGIDFEKVASIWNRIV